MRFRKGSKVEVLSEKEVPSGAWRCAEIISGNGHTYSVRYDWSPSMESQAVGQRVPRKAIRPCPPPVQGAKSWAVGDVAEVFDDGLWRMAKVLKFLDENYYLARLLGSGEEFRVHKYKIRVRQFWKDGKWAVIGKGPGSDYYNQMSSQVPQMNARIKLPVANDCLPPMDNTSCQDSHIVSSRSLKRASPYCSYYIEAKSPKMRAIERGCEHQQFVSDFPSSLLKKGQGSRLACLASKGLKMMLGFSIFACTMAHQRTRGNNYTNFWKYIVICKENQISSYVTISISDFLHI